MKLFELVLTEHIGEKEWTHHFLIRAKTINSAEKKAHKYARRFWSSSDDSEPARKVDDNSYEFNGGEIIVEVFDVKETTKEQFCQEVYERAMIQI